MLNFHNGVEIVTENTGFFVKIILLRLILRVGYLLLSKLQYKGIATYVSTRILTFSYNDVISVKAESPEMSFSLHKSFSELARVPITTGSAAETLSLSNLLRVTSRRKASGYKDRKN